MCLLKQTIKKKEWKLASVYNICVYLIKVFAKQAGQVAALADLCLGSACFEPWLECSSYHGRDFYGFPQPHWAILS
jgi:hypothetical protein